LLRETTLSADTAGMFTLRTDGLLWQGGDTAVDVARPRRLTSWPIVVYLLAGGSIVVAAAGGLLGAWESVAYLTIALATVAAMTVSVWRRRPSHIGHWVAIITAFVLFLVGGVARYQLAVTGNITESRSLIPDLLTLPGYLLLAAGLLGFARSSSVEPQRKWSVVLDASIAALAAAAVIWVSAIQPMLAQGAAPRVTLVLILYPSVSIFMVVVTLRIAFNPEQERVPAYWLLLMAVTFMLVSDVLYMLADAGLVAVPQRLLDVPYMLALLSAGTAALHPTMRMLTEPGRPTRMTRPTIRIALVGIALVVPALLVLKGVGSTTTDRVVLSLLMLAMAAAAVLRIVQALRIAHSSEARLVFQAHHDSLTELPNRRLMERHLSRLLDRARVDETHVALLYIDLDRFKLVNDTLGHRHGDELLVEVAGRLRANVRPSDLVTRIGGDEFMILLGDVVSISHALDLANRLRSCLKVPFDISGMTFYVSASVGLAYASGDDPAATVETLVRDADTAMYQAKDAGRDAVAVFDETMRARVEQRVEIERDLHDAVSLNQLHLVYQPIVRLPHGMTMGMEALVRWTHPEHGVVGPARFIPLAEEDGLIAEIGEWVLDEAVGQFAAWRRQWPDMANLYVSVNLSGLQLYDDSIVTHVTDALTLHGLPGSCLCLELTESVVMDDPDAAAAVLRELRRLGVQVAIDDFGSEYSSLAYLKRFPATILKIDQSFVGNVANPDSPDTTLVATIVAMAQGLGIGTVAEGVESSAQSERLVELGCDAAQGYLYSRPVGPDRLPEVVTSLGTHKLQLVKT
jgi:diguanylate cyclase (GGDEF)-like protein